MEGFDFLKEQVNVLAAGIVKRFEEIKKEKTIDGKKRIFKEIISDKSYNAAPATRKKWLMKIEAANTDYNVDSIVCNFVLAASGLKVIK